jgi:hypothetical protein
MDIQGIIDTIRSFIQTEPYLVLIGGIVMFLFFLRKSKTLRLLLLIGLALAITFYLILEVSSIGKASKRKLVEEHGITETGK